MSVDDIDGDGTHVNELNPNDLIDYLTQAESDLEKRARELLMAHPKLKQEAAQRLTEKVSEYLALSERRSSIRHDVWDRVLKLEALVKNLRDLGENDDADRYEAQARELTEHCFEARS